MRRIQSNEAKQSVQSLASIMPHTIDQLLQDQEDDKVASPNGEKYLDIDLKIFRYHLVLIDEINQFAGYQSMMKKENSYANNIMMTNDDNTQNNPEPVTVSSQTSMTKQPKENELFNRSSIAKKYLLIIIILFIILVMSLIGFIVGIILLKSELKTKEISCVEEQVKNNETIHYLRALRNEDNKTTHELANKAKRLEEELRKLNERILPNSYSSLFRNHHRNYMWL
jgi:hypothetical protein